MTLSAPTGFLHFAQRDAGVEGGGDERMAQCVQSDLAGLAQSSERATKVREVALSLLAIALWLCRTRCPTREESGAGRVSAVCP